MSLTVSFGQGGRPSQWYLPGSPLPLLPNPPPAASPPLGDALTGGPYLPAWDDAPLFGGLVRADTVGGTAHSFDVVGGWNSVKNAFAQSDKAEELRFDGFAHVDIDVGRGDPGGSSIVTVIGAKRGNIVTGAGDDIIRVELLSNEATWSTEFHIVSGAGDDVVELRGLDRERELASGDMTYASFANGAKGTWNTSGAGMRSVVDLGAGNDRFIGHGSDDTVIGGAGNDLADGGEGTDTWVLSDLRGGYSRAYADGRWLITDTDLTDGNDGRDDIGGFERVRFGDGSEMTLTPPPPPPGLVLWNRLGGEGEVAASEVGPAGTLAGGSFVSGVFGGAWRASAADASLYYQRPPGLDGLGFPSSVINPTSGTIEFWARLKGFSGWISSTGTMPGLIATIPVQDSEREPGGTWVLAFTVNDGGGGYGLSGQAGDRNFTATNTTFTPSYEGILGGDATGWHHYAFSWNAGGFAELGQPEREVMLFLDGVAVSSHWEERVYTGTGYGTGELIPPLGAILALAIDGPAWPAGTAVSFDNLKVWSGAKTDFSDRFDEDAGAPPPADTASLTFADIARGVGGFMVIGDGAYSAAGTSFAAIGDRNGDGIGDLLIGAPGERGGAYVVWGKADGNPVDLASFRLGSDQGYRIVGEAFFDRAGQSVAAIGDQDGDGRDDILIGAPEHSIVEMPTGDHAYLALIGAGYVVWDTASLANIALGHGGGTKTLGPAEFSFMGYAVAAIGDLNGDGRDEPLFAAPTTGEGPSVVHVGGTGLRVASDSGGLGLSLSSISDLNGDGLPEILLTHYSFGAYVVWGRATDATVWIEPTGEIATGAAGGFRVLAADPSVSAINDLNGDGLAEIVLGSRYPIEGATARVVRGKAGGGTVTAQEIDAGTGGFAVQHAWHPVSLGADLNGDGLSELIASDTEATYIVWGKADTEPVSLADVAAGRGGFRVFGDRGGFIPVGDMNGDGLPELFAGMPDDETGGPYAGAAFILFSTAEWLA